jgi:hypothetical protein
MNPHATRHNTKTLLYNPSLQIPTKSPAYSDFNARTIPILIRPPFRDIPTHFRGLADEQS